MRPDIESPDNERPHIENTDIESPQEELLFLAKSSKYTLYKY